MKKFNIIFFGDSVCTGQHVAIHKGWVTQVSSMLCQLGKMHETELVVTNASVNGRTTRQALEHINYEILSHYPEIVIVQFGMNDCNYWKSDKGLPRVSEQAFSANIREIIDRVKLFGTKYIFLNTNHPTALDKNVFPYTNITFQESNKLYNEKIREIARETDVIFNDVELFLMDYCKRNEMAIKELVLPSDGLHLSEKGHELYLECIFPKLKDVVATAFKNGK